MIGKRFPSMDTLNKRVRSDKCHNKLKIWKWTGNPIFSGLLVCFWMYPFAFYSVGCYGNDDNPKQPKGKSKLDFVVSADNTIYPIEVKSGEEVKAKSLRVFRNKYNPELSIRFSLKRLEYNEELLNIPLYYSFLFNDLLAQKDRLLNSAFTFIKYKTDK